MSPSTNGEALEPEWPTLALIERFKRSGDPAVRTRLLERHLGLVHAVAAKVLARWSTEAEFRDLVSAGVLGLMQALDGFDPKRGLQFSTYAVPRIRGAILDDLRQRDWAPRSARSRARRIADAQRRLSGELGREARPAEVAAALGIDIATFFAWQRAVQGAEPVSLDDVGTSRERRVDRTQFMSDPRPSPSCELDQADRARLVWDAVSRLPAQMRTVVVLYFFEDLKLHEISDILGLTESRISQIRKQGMHRLRTLLDEHRVRRAG